MTADLIRLLDLAERLGNLAEARLKSVGARHGLQSVHVRVLLYLAAANRYSNTPLALGEYLGLTKGTVSQSLILLETKGFLSRAADAHDRRVVRLVLTPAGRAVVVDTENVGHLRAAATAARADLLVDLTALLRQLQILEGRRSFGLCRTCRHHLAEGRGRWRCGLTGEPLTRAEGEQICREHESAGIGP
ncbi:MAG: MarR family transcriptional regulator [Pseudomonadota bacterium]|nr:MarR family transcriptional regulator [Pseudomonadota bacterium]MDP2352649.1 MarR family transcriptional regulator [Pseudomonadota bacterium]